jgi:uncharacterized protein YdeI (YjbR/CyaY-like superfamily)
MQQKQQQRFLENALRRMFRDVGQKYTREAVGKPEWFYEHTWTREQERKFQAWFAAEVAKDLGWDKRIAEKQARWFVLFHGWRLADLFEQQLERRTRKLRRLNGQRAYARWLRAPNPNLDGDTPEAWLAKGRLQAIADLVDDTLTGATT